MKHSSTVTQQKPSKKKKSVPFSAKLFQPMVLLSILQLCTFLGVMIFGGEFTLVRKYAYSLLVEKTENRKNYIESQMDSCLSPVYETNQEISAITENLLSERECGIDALSTDKSFSNDLIVQSTESLIYLMRVTAANDAFLILDTGELYGAEETSRKAGIYIRDMDTTDSSISDRTDLLLEAGNAEIGRNFDITLDYEWSAQIDVGDRTNENFDFYYRTMDTAKQFNSTDVYDLGYWSNFSRISRSAQPSIKYTLPLVTEDGTVYGVIGIGILEKNLLSNIPSKDLLNSSACYVLALDSDNSGTYTSVTHSGSIYNRIVGEDGIIQPIKQVTTDLYQFESITNLNIIGNTQELNVYNSGSPYSQQKWILISMADKSEILSIYTRLIRTILLASAISMLFCMGIAMMLNYRVTTPVRNIIHTLEQAEDTSIDQLTFDTSGIQEVDRLTDAITTLQENVREQASSVSKIISMVNIGIGVFKVNLESKKVFVGKSLILLFELKDLPEEDTDVSLEIFQSYMEQIDKNGTLFQNPIFQQDLDEQNHKVVTIELNGAPTEHHAMCWYQFSLARDGNNVLGVVQDITKSVLEMKKIEYERDYDITTGLFNRRAYLKKIEEVFQHPEKLKIAAFIMMDLDNLKYVNDTYGHDFGDDYIKTAANALKGFLGYGAIVARLSGDEFQIFLSGFDSKEALKSVIQSIEEKLNSSYCVLSDGTHYRIRASAGVSWYPSDSTSYNLLMKYADFAMYTVKHSTKGTISEFDSSTYQKDSILIVGLGEMNRIIDEQKIQYAFQPILSVKDGSIFGYEALMRPQSEELRSPMELIRIARTSAKLNDIERLTMFLGMRNFKAQQEKGNIASDAHLFINTLTNCTLREEDVEKLEQEFPELLPRVVLEILESESPNDDYMHRKQNRMKKWGAMTALDDFGSGYNSEYALITTSPNIIKIDRSIISGCDSDMSRQNIIINLVKLAKTKRIQVLAEGVETGEELKTVIDCGIDLLQGYYFSRPLFEPEPIDPSVIEEIKQDYANRKNKNKF